MEKPPQVGDIASLYDSDYQAAQIEGGDDFETTRLLLDEFKTELGKIDLTQEDQALVERALQFAMRCHTDQRRKDGASHLDHTLRVTSRIIREYGVTSAATISASLLHDAVEDQHGVILEPLTGNESRNPLDRSAALLRVMFGPKVARSVRALSIESSGGIKDEARVQRYGEFIAHAIKDPQVALIKLSDFVDNALTFHEIEDDEKRIWLAHKYLPVFNLLIQRIQEEDIPLSPRQKSEITDKLIAGRDNADTIVRTHPLS